jgi:hypothetical protein
MADSLVQGFDREKRRKDFLVDYRYKKTRDTGLMMVPRDGLEPSRLFIGGF